ncbi:unnamed protein product, partial [Amoebophrya sp. A25]|eukprot:GSA25T00004159001.1
MHLKDADSGAGNGEQVSAKDLPEDLVMELSEFRNSKKKIGVPADEDFVQNAEDGERVRIDRSTCVLIVEAIIRPKTNAAGTRSPESSIVVDGFADAPAPGASSSSSSSSSSGAQRQQLLLHGGDGSTRVVNSTTASTGSQKELQHAGVRSLHTEEHGMGRRHKVRAGGRVSATCIEAERASCSEVRPRQTSALNSKHAASASSSSRTRAAIFSASKTGFASSSASESTFLLGEDGTSAEDISRNLRPPHHDGSVYFVVLYRNTYPSP